MSGVSHEELIKLSLFIEMGKSISQTTTVKQTLTEVMRQVGNIFAPENWSLLLRDTKTGDLEFIICEGKKGKDLKRTRLQKGEGIAGWIAEQNEAVVVKDVYQDKRFAKRFDSSTGFKTQSIIGVPLASKEKVYGVIELINKLDGQSFNDYDLKVLKTIAEFAAIAIEKAYYLETVKKIAIKDEVTDAFSRSYFNKIFKQEVERCKRYRNELSILIVNVSNFSKISEQHGRKAGERTLKDMTQVLKNSTREVDKIFRLSYNELLILMPDTSKAQAEEMKERTGMHIFNFQSDHKQKYDVTFTTASAHKGDASAMIDLLNKKPEHTATSVRSKEPEHPENLAENIKDLLSEL